MKGPFHFQSGSVNEYYADVCRALIDFGVDAAPRGKSTKELHPTTVLITEPRKRIMTCHNRVINLPFALLEAIQILAGHNDPQALWFYNSQIIDIQGDRPPGTFGDSFWRDKVTHFNAAYGERLRHYSVGPYGVEPGTSYNRDTIDQLEHVIETLRHDPDSRQASIVLSHPLRDNYQIDTKDRACNVYAHAMIREGKLDWMQVIRSNDAVWGIPYNVVQWSHVQEYVAGCLGVEVGNLFIVQDSFHVYEDKYTECRAVEAFDLYDYLYAVPAKSGTDVLQMIVDTEVAIRRGGMIDSGFKDTALVVGTYWAAVLQAFLSYSFFKNGQSELAFKTAPVLEEIRLPLLRMYCHYRWNKDRERYDDFVRETFKDVVELGVPHEEAAKWLGIELLPLSSS
jgi:thymidylate synthase